MARNGEVIHGREDLREPSRTYGRSPTTGISRIKIPQGSAVSITAGKEFQTEATGRDIGFVTCR